MIRSVFLTSLFILLIGISLPVSAQTVEFTAGASRNEITGLYSLYAPTLLDENTMLLGGWLTSSDRTNFASWRSPFISWLQTIINRNEPINMDNDWPWQDTSRAQYIAEVGNPPAAVVGPDKEFRFTRNGGSWGQGSLVFEKVGEHINDGDVVRVGNTTYMFYTSLSNEAVAIATALNNFQHSFTKHEVGVARSTNNGSTWTDQGIVIARLDSGDGKGAWAPSAILVGGEIWVYYHTGTTNFNQPIVFRQKFNSSSLAKIGAPQRLAFTDDTGLLANVDVAKISSKYVLAGNLLGRAALDTLTIYHSDDGVTFSKLPDSLDGTNILVQRSSGVAVTPEIVPQGTDAARIYYGQGDGSAVGFDTIRSLDITISGVSQELPGSCSINTLQASKNLSGYAWSSTVGWVSMSCENAGTCSTSDYGVSVYPNGDINGYAWSSNIGWISFFGGDTQGCPSGECQAKLNRSTGEVTGWARALAPMCSASAPQSGNWDGWIYLGQSSRVGVTADGCEWGGYAWGGGENTLNGVVGWLSFAGPGYSVIGSGDACATSGQGVDLTAGTPSKTGINGDRQVRFSAPIINNGNQAVNQPVGGRLQIALHSDNSTEFDINIDVAEFVQSVGANGSTTGTYTWDNPPSGRHQIRVCADHNNLIPESNEDNNCGPVLTFQVDNPGNGGGLSASCTGAPLTPNIGQEVTWTASVQGNVGQTTYTWTGTDGLSGTGNPITKRYTSEGPKTARLTVEAENATKLVDCSTTVSVGGGGGGNTPTVTFEADPNEVLPGGSTTLVWSAQNASSCTGTGFSTGGRTSGQVVVQNIEETSTYQIRCVQGQRQAVANETVRVLAPNLSITADGIDDSTRVPKNKVVAIEWSAEDIDSCNVTGPGINLQNLTDDPLSDSQSVTIDQRSVYTLECFAAGRRFTDAVVVNIPPDFEEF